jgi:hypothetical protein
MSTIKSSAENLTLNADGANNDIIFQSNGSNVATLDQAGTLTATTFTGAATDATKLPLAGGTLTGNVNMNAASPIVDMRSTGTSYATTHYRSNSASQRATVGLEQAAGQGLFVGGSAYAAVFGTASPGSTQFATNNTVRMTIDTDGAVTNPYQPAFLATLSATQSNISAAGGHITVLFNSEIFDQNADFNTGTYTFTAPVTGKYQLNMSIMVENLDSASGYWLMKIVTSNRAYHVYQDLRGLSGDADQWTWTLPALADMDSGDTAYCTIKQYSGTDQTDVYTVSNFSGYLVA